MKSKICTKCGNEKLLDEFSLDKRRPNGKGSWCKECCNIPSKKYRQKHKKERKEYYLVHKEENKEKEATRQKKWYNEHKEEIKIKGKKYRNKHKDEMKKQKKKYREDHKEQIAIKVKKYQQEHKEELRKLRNKHLKKRRKTDLRFKIISNLRGCVRQTIKDSTKTLSTMFLIGCEIDYLLFHLQSQFKEGMSWDNYGRGDNGLKEWHIDHRRPCASFDLSKPAEQQKCFNYKNLQPLWAKDNLSKGAKWNIKDSEN